MTKKEEFQFIKDYIDDTMLRDSATGCLHLRCLWTAYCLHNNVEFGSDEYTEGIRDLGMFIYGALDRLHDRYNGDGSPKAFGDFMGELLA